MKRLHIVGKSKDNKKLLLAKTKGAKFGSFEIPIGAKLLKLVREVEEARNSHRKPAKEEPVETPTPATGAADAPKTGASPDAAASGQAPAADREPATRDIEIDLPIGIRRGPSGPPRPARRSGRRSATDAERAEAEEGADSEAPGNEDAADGGLPGQRFREQIRGRMQPRRKRPEIPARSNLSPAEIQTLIRAGRSVRSVAQLAGTSTAWIKWLAEPVEQERMGIVTQALQQRQVRPRLGASAATLGESVVINLRNRGMAAPERIVEAGFSALRDGRGWRVRLSYEHRGRRLNAVWSFDPQTKDLLPENTLAAGLGWRAPAGAEGTGTGAAPARARRSRAAPARPRRSRAAPARPRARSGRASKRVPTRSAKAKKTTARRGTTSRTTSTRRRRRS